MKFGIRNSEFGVRGRELRGQFVYGLRHSGLMRAAGASGQQGSARKTGVPAKIAFIAALTALCAVLLTSCVSVNFMSGSSGVSGRGTPETFTWEVGEFTDVRVELYANIEFYSAPSDIVTLEIQPNLREHIVVEESGGVLTVRSSRSINVTGGRAPVLTISTPELRNLRLAGAGVFTAHDTIATDSLTLSFDGAGSGTAAIDVVDLRINMSGAASFNLSGSADTARFNLSGAGSIEAFGLQTREASVDLSGVGTVRVNSSENLRINASGVGTVEYRGSPTVDINRDGLVTVRNVD